jgi:hypothetical protein
VLIAVAMCDALPMASLGGFVENAIVGDLSAAV